MKNEIIRIDLEKVNAYLVRAQGGFVLIDTGGHIVLDKEFTDRRGCLETALTAYGCTRSELRLILLTHGDNDHAANALYLREKYSAPIAMNAGDKALVDEPALEHVMRSFSYRLLVYRVVFRLLGNTIRRATARTLEDFKSFKPDILLEEGHDLSAYGLDARVLHLPGHTDGSIGVLFENGDFIAGDLFANTNKPSIAPNAFDFEQMTKSAQRLKGMGIKTVYPGHGLPFSFDELRL